VNVIAFVDGEHPRGRVLDPEVLNSGILELSVDQEGLLLAAVSSALIPPTVTFTIDQMSPDSFDIYVLSLNDDQMSLPFLVTKGDTSVEFDGFPVETLEVHELSGRNVEVPDPDDRFLTVPRLLELLHVPYVHTSGHCDTQCQTCIGRCPGSHFSQ